MIKNLNLIANDTNKFLNSYIKKQSKTELIKSMKYGLLPGGKKIRSKILIDVGRIFNLNYRSLIRVGAAVECIHAYTLIHDDLPCMDDDKIRRGKAATHIKFGESTAILAGNSLQTIACEILASPNLRLSEKIKINLVKKLSECSGHLGVAGGQYLDLSYEKKKFQRKRLLKWKLKKQESYLVFAVQPQQLLKKKTIKRLNFLKILDLMLVCCFK